MAVVIAFFVCYAPLYLQRLLSAIMGLNSNLNSHSNLFSKIMAYLYIISGTTFYFGSVINPILYNVVSNKYRRAFRDLFCCRLTCKTKTKNLKNQRKIFHANRLSDQPIHYFVKKPPLVLQKQRNINTKLYEDSNQQQQCINDKQIEILNMIAPSSSINSHHREHLPIHFLNSHASLTKECQVSKQRRFSLREKLLRQKQPTDTVPWLVIKNRV